MHMTVKFEVFSTNISEVIDINVAEWAQIFMPNKYLGHSEKY